MATLTYIDANGDLAEYRHGRGWTQQQCADELVLGVRTVRRCEQGRPIRPSTARKIKDATDGAVRFKAQVKVAAE